MVQFEAVRAGLGVGFLAEYVARLDADIVAVLPDSLRIPPLPMWLAVHREIRSNPRIRAVFDFLAEALPAGL
jgi:DNA-binding transcriptional LysR family regulator